MATGNESENLTEEEKELTIYYPQIKPFINGWEPFLSAPSTDPTAQKFTEHLSKLFWGLQKNSEWKAFTEKGRTQFSSQVWAVLTPPVLSLRLLSFLMKPERRLLPFASERGSTAIFKVSDAIVLMQNKGWPGVLEGAKRIQAQKEAEDLKKARNLGAATSSASPQLTTMDGPPVVQLAQFAKRFFGLNSYNNVILNITLAALNLALNLMGMFDYPSKWQEFVALVKENCRRAGRFISGLEDLSNDYKAKQWQFPLAVTFGISPVALFIPRALYQSKTNRLHVFGYAWSIGSYRPMPLVPIEIMILNKLLEVAQGKKSAATMFKEVTMELPDLTAISIAEREFFFPGSDPQPIPQQAYIEQTGQGNHDEDQALPHWVPSAENNAQQGKFTNDLIGAINGSAEPRIIAGPPRKDPVDIQGGVPSSPQSIPQWALPSPDDNAQQGKFINDLVGVLNGCAEPRMIIYVPEKDPGDIQGHTPSTSAETTMASPDKFMKGPNEGDSSLTGSSEQENDSPFLGSAALALPSSSQEKGEHQAISTKTDVSDASFEEGQRREAVRRAYISLGESPEPMLPHLNINEGSSTLQVAYPRSAQVVTHQELPKTLVVEHNDREGEGSMPETAQAHNTVHQSLDEQGIISRSATCSTASEHVEDEPGFNGMPALQNLNESQTESIKDKHESDGDQGGLESAANVELEGTDVDMDQESQGTPAEAEPMALDIDPSHKRKASSAEPDLRRSIRQMNTTKIDFSGMLGSSSTKKSHPTKTPKTEANSVKVDAKEVATERNTVEKVNLERVEKFQPTTTKQRILGAKVTLHHYDGSSSIEYQPSAYDQKKLDSFANVITALEVTAEYDRKCQEQNIPVKLPIRSIPYFQWLKMPVSERQYIFHEQNILLTDCPWSNIKFDPSDPKDVELLLGDLEKERVIHDPSRLKDEGSVEYDANDLHVIGTLRDFATNARTGAKIINLLDLPRAPDGSIAFQAPGNLATDVFAETEMGIRKVDMRGRIWAIAGSEGSMHEGHLDLKGLVTEVLPLTGEKYWVVACPRPGKSKDLASLDAFGDEFDVDFSNTQEWCVYGLNLRPGCVFIQHPCMQHFVINIKPSICYGRHKYNSQTMALTSYGVLQSFAAANLLTNSIHFGPMEALQHILLYWSNKIVEHEEDYLKLVKRAGKDIKSNGSHIIPHLPNLFVLSDLEGALALCNLVRLGRVLDLRRYLEMEGQSTGIWSTDEFIPEDTEVLYNEGREQAEELVRWIVTHFKLELTGAVDKCTDTDRLSVLSGRFFVDQCKALVLNKKEAEDRGVLGEDVAVTAERIRGAIELDFGEDSDFKALWPPRKGKSLVSWIKSWANEGRPSYAFPDPPNGGKYSLTLVE